MSSDPRPSKRPFLSSLECSICFEAYDLNTRAPIIGNCGHTICAACRTRLPTKCPICQKRHAFMHEIKNFSLIQMIEEKLSEAKRQKTDPGCSLCQSPVDDASSHVCLECVKKKNCNTFKDLMKEVASCKMCSRCAEAIQKHDGHESHKLCDAKSGLLSMLIKNDIEDSVKYDIPQLDMFQTASGIFNETFREFYEACMANSRMTGSQSEFSTLQKIIANDVLRFHKTLVDKTSSLWELTNECLEATQVVRREKQKLQGREFSQAEDITFRAILASTRDDLSPIGKVDITTEDWKRMTPEERKAKTLKMVEDSREASDEN